MSTKDTDKTESTTITEPTTTATDTNDNKTVFGPLGKYAVVAVIMVSIIVTTAIMLNKQLGTVEEQLAAMESEVAEINDANTSSIMSTEASDTEIESQSTTEVADVETAQVAIETAEVQAVEAPEVTEVPVVAEGTANDTVTEVAAAEEQVTATEVASSEPAMSVSSEEDQVQLDMTTRDQERQARIEAYKAEQKQRMTEIFARIQTLEAQQLDKYKTSQDNQIERLREQIAKQEKLIEALILRNQERVEMREASMQRSQSNRAKMLERI